MGNFNYGKKELDRSGQFDLGGTVCDGIDEATGLGNIGPINDLKFSIKEVWGIDPDYEVILPHMATRKLDHLYKILTTPSITEEFKNKHGREKHGRLVPLGGDSVLPSSVPDP